MKKADLVFGIARVPLDFCMLLAAGAVAYLLRTQILDFYRPALFQLELPFLRYMVLVAGASLLVIGAYAASGLYSLKIRLSRWEEFGKVLVATSAGVLAVIVTIFLRQELFNSRFLVLGWWLLALLFVSLARLAVRRIRSRAVGRFGYGIHRIAVIGNDATTHALMDTIIADPSMGWRIAGHLLELSLSTLEELMRSEGIDEVLLGNPNMPTADVAALIEWCHERHVLFKFVPNISYMLTMHYDVETVGRVPVIELKRSSLDGWGKVAKRSMDIALSVLGLVVCIPIFAVTAIAIKWETAGPVFVRLRRVSRNKEFFLYKFRSMVENAEELKPYLFALNERADGPLWKMRDDPRVTRVGKVIRKFRIDELPQFANILKGEMSLVGPRPHQPDEIARYQKHHKKVLAVDAGATGLAQISGSSDLPFDQEVAIDSYYIDHWSLWMDMKIILQTALRVVRDRSAV